jgi:hypothetical protein
MIQAGRHGAAALIFSLSLSLSLSLAGCGGSNAEPPLAPAPPVATTPPPVAASRVDLLAATTAGIGSVAVSGTAAWLAVSNSTRADSAMFRAALPLRADSAWNDVALGDCAVAREDDGFPLRAPALRTPGSGLWLVQAWYDKGPATGPDARPQHALCAYDDAAAAFVPRDGGLQVCADGFCSVLSPSDLKQAGTRLYTNAGGGQNVLVSSDAAASWQVLTGRFDQDICTHPAFEIVGDRLLVGGECPLDMAFLRAYRLGSDGAALATADALPLTLPNLENRNVQFIRATGGQRVFAGVEGGLLRSEDGGRAFRFVIEQPVGGAAHYPYIRHLLALAGKPDTLVAGGFDKATHKPYLAWSADGGTTWTDLSALLPGYARNLDDGSAAMVTSIVQDPQGHILVTVNEQENAQGRLVQLTLGTPGH